MLPTWSWEYPLSLLSSFSSFTSSSPSPGINITSLTPLLSPSAQIILPSSPLFTNFSSRFTQAAIPSYAAIIAVSTENDVVETIKFANTLGIPFLATGTSHGAWAGLNDFQGGIGIWLRNLTKFELNSQGDEVTLGGGLRSVDVVSRLWEVKKQTTTGVCECVSLAAPALGGGHGYLQGQRGLVADQLVSARVVLADGRVVTASSDTGNGGDGDLFWAIKGAGHNFGVVTEMVFKVYDVVKPEWVYEYLFFTGDKVGELYEVANAMLETQAAEAVLWTTWVRMPDVDPINVGVPKLDQLTLRGKELTGVARRRLIRNSQRPSRHSRRLGQTASRPRSLPQLCRSRHLRQACIHRRVWSRRQQLSETSLCLALSRGCSQVRCRCY